MIPQTQINSRRAFSLVELLVVISIIGVLAAFTIVSVKAIAISRKVSTARGELIQIESALENYKAKYGNYPPGNQNANSIYTPQNDRAQFSQLYFELSGTTKSTIGGVEYFVTLDSAWQIKAADVKSAYGVGGFLNCSKGGAEDSATAKNFLPSLNTKLYHDQITNNGVSTTVLTTSVGGPDDNYKPLQAVGVNPIRYRFPGVNNTGSYDLWVQLVINGKTNLVCNWSKAVQINTPDL
jgi:prepilin-type N-terminal cleavage/methylation domain-containing protein